ncbi:hypothetical protein [Paenibacillus eucommiae]|uniref:Uncharacterized protein n=1 Tax=Paenibacillus eucommiae TaxID=1355755 RepID=A0ABS4IZM7_9BACL|nr:hypothetical protein [Paenibacillus eucommiae]MBP1993049.1 hypothetical protein [Paenibacillus eucommiae]
MSTFIRSLMKVLIGLIPTLFMFYILIELFPYTGLGRIVALPSIFILNTIIIVLGVYITHRLNRKRLSYTLAWFTILLLTVLNTIVLYPQEFSPSVSKQVWYSISAIKNFDDSPIKDMKLPISHTNEGANEKYIVALYKYRLQIPLDGSYFIYREYKSDMSSNDTAIKTIEDIPTKLKGHHKLIWWFLETTRR